MNRQEADVLKNIYYNTFLNQRYLAETCGYSLGVINRAVHNLLEEGYLDDCMNITDKAHQELERCRVKSAVILAAGFGMRMVSIDKETPKALLEIEGERLIERQIKHLREVGINDIYVVVGFKKEQFEYLIDKYQVTLVVNEEYSSKNNIHSLKLVLSILSNTYIIPCDIWMEQNPFDKYELYSWYMVSDAIDAKSNVRVNRKMELVSVPDMSGGNKMIGISYLAGDDAKVVRKRIEELCKDRRYEGAFWEESLYQKDRMMVAAKVVKSSGVMEIDTQEQLSDMDKTTKQMMADALHVISETLGCLETEIRNIEIIKRGTTNRTFSFECRNKKYVMRCPEMSKEPLVSRMAEAEVYRTIEGMGLCDSPIYINEKTGHKISCFLEGVHSCDKDDKNDLKCCMRLLKQLHVLKLNVSNEFDLYQGIEKYEELREGKASVYGDYKEVKKSVFSLREFIEMQKTERCLCHIDAVPDNFLISDTHVQLIDWEYAAMQDPHLDIAMFCVHSMYSKAQVDRVIDIYFDNRCDLQTRTKIYCYISVAGLLWSNWCEYKMRAGVEFGEYSLRQYRFAKDYYRYARNEMEKLNV